MVTSVTPRGKTTTLLVGAQSAFGALASGNWTQTYYRKHSLAMKQPYAEDPVLGLPRTNNRDVTAPAPGLITLGGSAEYPLDYNHCGIHFTAAFGAATDSGSGDPYTHTWTSGGEALPYLSKEVAIVTPSGTIYMDYNSLALSKLTLKASRTAGEESITCDYIGQQEVQNSSSQGGTPATPWARDMVQAAIGTFAIGGTAAAGILEFNGTYDNGLKPEDFLGNSAGMISGIDLDTESTFKGTIKLRFRNVNAGAAGETYYALAAAQSAFDGTLSWSRASGRLVQLDMQNMRLEPDGITIEGPSGIDQTYNFRCEQSSSAPMITMTVKNLVPTYGAGP
jgi:hypothetical protein